MEGLFAFDVHTAAWERIEVDLSGVRPRTGHAAFMTPKGLCFHGGYMGPTYTQRATVTNQFVFVDLFVAPPRKEENKEGIKRQNSPTSITAISKGC